MNDDSITPIAEIDSREDHRVFGIKRKDRRFHMAIIGRTGTGKSTLMKTMIQADARVGEGFALLDPHGDLAEEVWESLPVWRRKGALHFDPANPSNAITFNPLEVPSSEQRHLVVADLIAIFNRIWERSWGPRLEYILRNVFMALTERPGYTLLDALRLLADADFRQELVGKIEDDIVRQFFELEFGKYSKSYRTEAIAPIQNKLGEFLVNPVLRRVFSDPVGSIAPRALMDAGGVLVADLSVGKLGRDASTLLGAMLVGKFGLAALSRADIPIAARQDFQLYVDEFPSFATSSFATILAEARKYRLSLTVAMQYFDQLDAKLAGALFGNVGSLITFRVGVKDATILEREFRPTFNQDDLIALPYYRAYVKLVIDGKPARPFSARVVAPEVAAGSPDAN
jgi:DNA helicase HerA-like ATPase